MLKKNVYIIVIVIFLLAFLAANFCYSKYWNNFQFSIFNFRIKLPPLPEVPFKLGLDLQGGVHLLYQADLSNIEEKEKSNAMAGLRDVIERRVNFFGVKEPMVQVQGERLIVELAGVVDPEEAIRQIGKTPFLEFRELKPEEEVNKIKAKQEELKGKKPEEFQNIENWQLAFEEPFKPTNLTGRYLKKAKLSFDQTTYKPLVSLEFNDEGAKIFEELTEKNVGKQLAIYIDNSLISAPVVQEKISGGKAQISGRFTVREAKELARNLNAGALPVPIKLISQQRVGPILGKISLEQSLKAGLLGFLAVILFMIIFYRLPGVISAFALLIYISFLLTLFKLVPVTLTLAGVAGFILSIGMAVDANVLIFARMREELREGKTFSIALEEGFRRAWPSIRDGNLTTLIVTAILFGFGTSFIKGFALTLALGILMSMFSAIFLTKNFLKIFEETKLEILNWLWR